MSRSALPFSRADGEDELLHTAKFVLVLKVGDVRLTPLVHDDVDPAPRVSDPPEVAAGVLSLSVVAHVVYNSRLRCCLRGFQSRVREEGTE
jgi:hypothetical protein